MSEVIWASFGKSRNSSLLSQVTTSPGRPFDGQTSLPPDAINMDGGGSTTLVYWSPVENQPVLLNQPNKSNYQRTVGASLGIYYAPVRRQRR